MENRIVKVMYLDDTVHYIECSEWQIIHESRILLCLSVKKEESVYKPKIGINLDSVKLFHDITNNKKEMDLMERETSIPTPQAC